MNVFDLVAKITLDSSEYDQGLAKVAKGIGSTLGTAAKVGTAAVGVAATGIGALVKASVDGYKDYEQLVGGVETLYKDSADKVQQYANDAYKTAGMSANDYMETATSFAASLINSLDGDTDKAAEMANMAITDMSDNVNKMGSSVESVQNAYNGFAKGNFTMLDNLKLGYGGTKEEMQRLLDRAEEIKASQGEVADYSIDSYADIVEAIHVVQDEMGITGTTAKEANQTISGSMAAAKSAWDNLVLSFATGNGDIKEKSAEFINSALTVVQNVIPAVKTALAGIGTFVGEAVPVILDELPGLIKEVFPGLIQTAMTLVGNLIDALPELLSSLWTAVKEAINTTLATIYEDNPALGYALTSIWEAVNNMINNLIELWDTTLKPALSSLLDFIVVTVVPAIMEAWPKVKDAIAGAFETIKTVWDEKLSPVLTTLWTFIKDTLIPKIGDLIAKFIEFKDNTLVPVWGFIRDNVIKIFESLRDTWVDKILPKIGELKEKFDDFKENVLSPLWTFLKNSVITIFSRLYDTWVEDILPTLGRLKEKFDDFKENVITPIRDFIRDHFTTTFSDMGEKLDWIHHWIIEPLATFLSGTFSLAVEAVSGIVGGALEAIQWLIDKITFALEKLREFRQANSEAQAEYNGYVDQQVQQGTYYGPGFAKGGTLRSGSVWVGEEAPEILSVKNGVATVTPIGGSGRHTPVGNRIQNNTINVYQQPGESMEELAERIDEILTRQYDREEAVFA